MVLAGVVDAREGGEILERVVAAKSEKGMVSPYMNYHYVGALLLYDKKEKAMEYMKYYHVNEEKIISMPFEFSLEGGLFYEDPTELPGDRYYQYCTASGCMRAGNDLVMPGCVGDHENLKRELEAGTLNIEDLKACIARLVSVIWKSNQYEEN